MKTIVTLGMSAVLASGMIAPVMANPLSDVCEIRAERISGYSGDRRGLTWTLGQVDIRISGMAAIGLSHTSGSPTGITYGPNRPFSDITGLEERDARKKRKYAEVYKSCMQAG